MKPKLSMNQSKAKTLWLADWLVILLTVVCGLAVGWALLIGAYGLMAVEVLSWAIGGAIYLEYRAVSR